MLTFWFKSNGIHCDLNLARFNFLGHNSFEWENQQNGLQVSLPFLIYFTKNYYGIILSCLDLLRIIAVL